VRVECVEGYRAGSTSPAAPSSYELPCLAGCQTLQPPAAALCTPVVCAAVQLPLHASFQDGDAAGALLPAAEGQSLGSALQHRQSVRITCDLGYKVEATACDLSFQVSCLVGFLGLLTLRAREGEEES